MCLKSRLTLLFEGGPFDKEGEVGKQFKADGSIGGTVVGSPIRSVETPC